MTILPYGDSAILINFKQIISEEINAQAISLSNSISSGKIKGVTFCIPAYCSVTVGYEPQTINYNTIREKIFDLYSSIPIGALKRPVRNINIPVCYEEEFALDKHDIKEQTHLSWEEVIKLHTSIEYTVYMLGFIAGFAYLGTLPLSLKCARKSTPRMNIPAGTVGIAGLQTGIYPKEAHAGWQLMGRTPIRVFDVKAEHPFLFSSGDIVQFSSIDRTQYESYQSEMLQGTFDIKSVISDA
jgi:inhibitor of KinA